MPKGKKKTKASGYPELGAHVVEGDETAIIVVCAQGLRRGLAMSLLLDAAKEMAQIWPPTRPLEAGVVINLRTGLSVSVTDGSLRWEEDWRNESRP